MTSRAPAESAPQASIAIFLAASLAIALILFIQSPLTFAQTAPDETSATAPVITWRENSDMQPIEKALSYITDKQDKLTFSDILKEQAWQPIASGSPNFGFTRTPHWFTFQLFNETFKQQNLILEISSAALDKIDLYIVNEDSTQGHTRRFVVGDHLRQKDRPIEHHFFAFPVEIQSQSNLRFYYRIQTEGVVESPIRIWKPEAFYKYQNHSMLLHGIYFGIMLIMSVYNFFIFLSMRLHSYIYYVWFVTSFTFFYASLHGLSYQYLWPEAIHWNSICNAFFIANVAASTSFFARSFLNLKKLSPFGNRIFLVLGFLSTFLILMNFFIPYNIMIRAGSSIAIPIASSALFFGYLFWFKNISRHARFFCIAWTIVASGTLILTLSKFGWLPKNFFTTYAAQIGAVIEVAMLSFALGDRINQERKAKDVLQRKTIVAEQKALKTQGELLDLQKQTNKDLEFKVQERTLKLEETIQALAHANTQLELANLQLKNLTLIDQLTKLNNRRYFDERYNIAFIHAVNEQEPISIIMCDIDYFKAINDNFGHAVGDACLSEVGRLFKTELSGDHELVARYGGEEFIVLLINANKDDALNVAETLRSLVEVLRVQTDDQSIRVTASFGVSTVIPDASYTASYLVKAADQALYTAKKNGRNCVVFDDAPPHSNYQASEESDSVQRSV